MTTESAIHRTLLSNALASVGVTTFEMRRIAEIRCIEVAVSSEEAAVAIRYGLKGAFRGRSYRGEGLYKGLPRFVVSVSY